METAIWLTEVAPQAGKSAHRIIEHLANANKEANPELMRLALKLANWSGKDHCHGYAYCLADDQFCPVARPVNTSRAVFSSALLA